jgi:hypothetical protein
VTQAFKYLVKKSHLSHLNPPTTRIPTLLKSSSAGASLVTTANLQIY